MKVFISGPMSGYEAFNFPAFHEAEVRFREAGIQAFNPAHLFEGYPADQPPTRSECIVMSLEALFRCNAIALLPGWIKSRGAMLEVITAKELGFKFFDAVTLEPIEVYLWEDLSRIVM